MRRRRKKTISSVVGSTDYGTRFHVPSMFVVEKGEESSRTREVKREEEEEEEEEEGSRIRRERDLFHVFKCPASKALAAASHCWFCQL